MTPAEIEGLARRFFDAIEAGDIEGVGACYADDVVIWHNTDGLETSKAQNVETLSNFVRYIPERRYRDRRLTAYPGGFVQQHRLAVKRRDGKAAELQACIVCAVADGAITRLDEYFDAAQVAALSQ
ncbi:MAG TPA: nuclear transport factor 2 family protein [Phenylobacterium sp.]|nr:nuclear transport factor 2 family protein [Phenylobacterium sp.]